MAARHAVFLILLPLLLACVVVTVVRILLLDLEEAVDKVNKSQLSDALVRVSHPTGRLDVTVEETAAKEDIFQSQIATLQVELFLQNW